MENTNRPENTRREFVKKALSSCALCCLAAKAAIGADENYPNFLYNQPHKFKTDAGLTMEEVFNLAYKKDYIPTMKALMKQVGEEKFLEMLKTAADMRYAPDNHKDINYSERTLTVFGGLIKELAAGKAKLIQTVEFIHSDDHLFEMKVTECLWAKTFREEDAADIGYASFCYQDYPATKNFNPDITLHRDKTIMLGDEYCHNRWILET